jgi:predicted phage-related endonuclease
MTPTQIQEKAKEIKKLTRLMEELEAEITSLQDEIKAEMTAQQTDQIIAGEYKIRWTAVTSSRFDTTGFKAKYQDLYSQFTKPSTSKRFTIA